MTTPFATAGEELTLGPAGLAHSSVPVAASKA